MHHHLQLVATELLGIVGRQRIIHFMPGLQYRTPEDDCRFLLLSLAQLERPLESSALENGQRDGRTKDKLMRGPITQAGKLERLGAKAARQRDLRIEISLRDANLGSRGVQLCFRPADVGTPSYQFRRKADWRALWQRRNFARVRQRLPERTGFFAEQEA